jgi:Family of unknown function (DUF6527)
MTLPAPLGHEWFDAKLIGHVSAELSYRFSHEDGTLLNLPEAQGLTLWCPCGFGKPEFPTDGGRPHLCMIVFANPPRGVLPPATFGPVSRDPKKPRPRWHFSGTGISDMTLSPSVAVGDPECWHGYIQNGIVRV